MKSITNALIVILILLPFTNAKAQKRWYVTSNYEYIFSWSGTEYGTESPNNVLRFAPWFNLSSEYNFDFSQRMGATLGFGVRNIGFIYDVPQSEIDKNLTNANEVRKKFRNYTLGVPIGIKIGDMNKRYIFGGYEIELPFHYKEKTFLDGNKKKHTDWFSNRTPNFYHSVFAGVQLPGGAVLKFKYYFTDFFNQDVVSQSANWGEFNNYYPSKANVMYISLVVRLLKNNKIYYKEYGTNTTFSMN